MLGQLWKHFEDLGGSYWDNYWDDMKQGYRNHRIYEYGNIDAIYDFLYMLARSIHRGYVYIYINIGKLSDGFIVFATLHLMSAMSHYLGMIRKRVVYQPL